MNLIDQLRDQHSHQAICRAMETEDDQRPLPTVDVKIIRRGVGNGARVCFRGPDGNYFMGRRYKDIWSGKENSDDFHSPYYTGTRYCPHETADGEPLKWVNGHLTSACFERLVARYGPKEAPASDPLAHLRELAEGLPEGGSNGMVAGRHGMVVGRHIGLLMNIAEEVRRLRDETDLLKGRE